MSRKLFNEFKEKYSYPKVGEVLISASGTIGRTVIFDGRESYFQDSNIVWIENNEKIVLNKYLFYFYKIAKWGISEGGTIKRLYNDNLRKLMIPVPFPDSPERSLVEQQKIVKLLDKFDALTNSITEGLPREIELRQKQYEYYRDLLFSFPKPETISN
ncbi:restriction endonuclease subunit S [Escherichia coli]|uniref:restriction endonuclease subunit S n=1 Tax=Escherichia coli TaxID=562 RepID=UPI003D8D3C2A